MRDGLKRHMLLCEMMGWPRFGSSSVERYVHQLILDHWQLFFPRLTLLRHEWPVANYRIDFLAGHRDGPRIVIEVKATPYKPIISSGFAQLSRYIAASEASYGILAGLWPYDEVIDNWPSAYRSREDMYYTDIGDVIVSNYASITTA